MCSDFMPLLLGGGFLGNTLGVCAGKQMLQSMSAGEQLPLHRDSVHIHVSPTGRKRPSGEVITQEALQQG